MGSFGERLRREREMRGITIEEIAEATKIGSRNLRALEEERFEQLPGGIFNKGFVRAYSKYLGLDEEQAVADYMTAESAFVDGSSDDVDAPVETASRGSLAFPVAIVLLLAVAGGGFGGWKYYQKRVAQRAAEPSAAAQRNTPPAPIALVTPPPTTQTASSVPDAAAAPAAASTASARAPEAAAPAAASGDNSSDPAASDGFVVQLKATTDSWVSAKADGKSILSGTLKATNEKTLRAHDKLVLTIGNAGGVQVSYNGKSLNLGSATGQVKTLTFTAQGLQSDAPEQRP